jgi:hypothetical protein
MDPMERAWNVVLWKEPQRRHVTKKVQTDPMEFDMFKFEIIDEFLGYDV